MKAQGGTHSATATALAVHAPRAGQRGAAAVEMALVLPLFLIIVFGIMEFGVILFDKAMVTNASREGARRGVVFGYPDRPSDEEIENVALDYCQTHLVSLGGGTGPTASVTRAGTGAGDSLTVTVTYDYNFLVLPGFMTALTGPLTLQGVSVMRLE